ncbi:hypothetical protein GCK32_017341 [Trichostrongylus colubriformis]|uniref:Uncharacterized protein n=1 Tax=Trichostrongylus colubriformis TaxID=6319 RepID=A0AAN8FRE9_TRICO
MNPNTQSLQYDQSSNTFNNQQTYPSSQNSAYGAQYNPNMPYNTQQNQAGYNPQGQQMDQNQYLDGAQVQSSPYNQPGYNTQQQSGQNQYFSNGQTQTYPNSQQQNGYGQQYDTGMGQTQNGQSIGNQAYSNDQSQNALYGSVGSTGGNTQVQVTDYSFTNGNCRFENGYVTENGQQRQATQQDMAIVAQYKQALSDYMRQLNSNMGDWVSDILKTFSFTQGQNIPTTPSLPAAPQVPCLCSPQSCANSQQTQQNVAYDPSNQYGQQGNQYQQTVAPYNNQYQSNTNQYQPGTQQAPPYNGRRK